MMRWVVGIAFLVQCSICFASSSQDFNGTTDLLSCGSATSLDDLTTLTVAAWIDPDTAGEGSLARISDKQQATAGWAFFVCKVSAGGCSSSNDRLKLISDWSGGQGAWVSPASSITEDTWQHVAFTYDSTSSSNDPIFYINGALVSTTENTTPTTSRSSDAAQTLSIGNNTAASRTFDGSLAYVHIYNRILSVGEIKEIMFHPGIITSGLVLYQPILGNDGVDLSGNSNTCTVTGTTASALGPPVYLVAP